MKRIFPFVLILTLLGGCQSQADPPVKGPDRMSSQNTAAAVISDPLVQPTVYLPIAAAPRPNTTASGTTIISGTTPALTTALRPETPPTVEPLDADFVRIIDFIPDAMIDLRYATDNNFTGKQIYTFQDAWLRCGTAKKLAQAAGILREQGYRLLIWDVFCPTSAQWKLWSICPDSTYVSNPNKGFSSHSRGNTVDLSIVTADGSEVEMPTGFDDFTPAADRDYSDVSDEAAKNARMLEKVLSDCGFKPYVGEWWHYSDVTVYEVETAFLSEEYPKGVRYVN